MRDNRREEEGKGGDPPVNTEYTTNANAIGKKGEFPSVSLQPLIGQNRIHQTKRKRKRKNHFGCSASHVRREN